MKQMIMLNHAAVVTHKRIDKKYEMKRERDKAQGTHGTKDSRTFGSKPVSKMTSAELKNYYKSFVGG